MNFDPALEKLESGVANAKKAIARADVAANKYKIGAAHHAAIDRAEHGVNRTLTLMDKIFPENRRGMAQKFTPMLNLAAFFAAFFIIGSTAALWWFTREKPEKPKRPQRAAPPGADPVANDDEYEYVDEGKEEDGYEYEYVDA